MHAADTDSPSDQRRSRPATADVRAALIMQQRLRAAQAGPPPSRAKIIARTVLAALVLGAAVAVIAIVGLALLLFTLGIAVAATAALLVVALVDRLRGRPARRMAVPAVFIRRS